MMNKGGRMGNSFDAIIIGAGISGIYQLHKLRGLGMHADESGGQRGVTVVQCPSGGNKRKVVTCVPPQKQMFFECTLQTQP